MSLRIGILMGGRSAEREVSLKSGRAVYDALLAKGYDVKTIDVNAELPAKLKETRVEIAFIALHGQFGEDGTVQGMLELLNIPYTGSGVLASALAMDKITTKRILQAEGLPTPRFAVYRRPEEEDEIPELAGQVWDEFNGPVVVKPPGQGSSLGVTVARNKGEVVTALQTAFQYGDRALVEEFIPGVEITVPLLGNRNPRVLPLIEITSETGRYDYESKYTPGMSTHIIPPRIPDEIQAEIGRLAVQTFDLLSCRGLARVDFIVSEDGKPYILELNTIPGLTPVSLFPDAAKAAGIDLSQLAETLLALAQESFWEAGGFND
ncbi:MAG: D-alanine--D-alanine ligase [Desulforudis sp.]|nr:MAG: D-alanine--D-alanine ligase [Desulforudis sp.]